MSALRFPHLRLPEGKTSLSLDEFKQLQEDSKSSAKGEGKKQGRPSKFNAIAVQTEHGRFDSKMEYQRFLQLQLLERAGKISNLKKQVSYPLIAGDTLVCTYIADFVYEENGKLVVEDSKGFKTKEYQLKKKLMKKLLDIDIFETGHRQNNKKRAQRRSS